MFYSTQILARKGPLGIVWIAAHKDLEKLTRHQTTDTYIPGTVDALLHPEAPLALRLSGQLLLGVVRLFSRKVTFLHQDCQVALVTIRRAIQDGDPALAVLLPEEHWGAGAPGPGAAGDAATLLQPAGGKQGGRAAGKRGGAASRAAAQQQQQLQQVAMTAEAWGGVVDLVEAALLRDVAAAAAAAALCPNMPGLAGARSAAGHLGSQSAGGMEVEWDLGGGYIASAALVPFNPDVPRIHGLGLPGPAAALWRRDSFDSPSLGGGRGAGPARSLQAAPGSQMQQQQGTTPLSVVTGSRAALAGVKRGRQGKQVLGGKGGGKGGGSIPEEEAAAGNEENMAPLLPDNTPFAHGRYTVPAAGGAATPSPSRSHSLFAVAVTAAATGAVSGPAPSSRHHSLAPLLQGASLALQGSQALQGPGFLGASQQPLGAGRRGRGGAAGVKGSQQPPFHGSQPSAAAVALPEDEMFEGADEDLGEVNTLDSDLEEVEIERPRNAPVLLSGGRAADFILAGASATKAALPATTLNRHHRDSVSTQDTPSAPRVLARWAGAGAGGLGLMDPGSIRQGGSQQKGAGDHLGSAGRGLQVTGGARRQLLAGSDSRRASAASGAAAGVGLLGGPDLEGVLLPEIAVPELNLSDLGIHMDVDNVLPQPDGAAQDAGQRQGADRAGDGGDDDDDDDGTPAAAGSQPGANAAAAAAAASPVAGGSQQQMDPVTAAAAAGGGSAALPSAGSSGKAPSAGGTAATPQGPDGDPEGQFLASAGDGWVPGSAGAGASDGLAPGSGGQAMHVQEQQHQPPESGPQLELCGRHAVAPPPEAAPAPAPNPQPMGLPPRPPKRAAGAAAAAAAGAVAAAEVGVHRAQARRRVDLTKLVGPKQAGAGLQDDSEQGSSQRRDPTLMGAAEFRALYLDRSPLLAARGLEASASAKRQCLLPPGLIVAPPPHHTSSSPHRSSSPKLHPPPASPYGGASAGYLSAGLGGGSGYAYFSRGGMPSPGAGAWGAGTIGGDEDVQEEGEGGGSGYPGGPSSRRTRGRASGARAAGGRPPEDAAAGRSRLPRSVVRAALAAPGLQAAFAPELLNLYATSAQPRGSDARGAGAQATAAGGGRSKRLKLEGSPAGVPADGSPSLHLQSNPHQQHLSQPSSPFAHDNHQPPSAKHLGADHGAATTQDPDSLHHLPVPDSYDGGLNRSQAQQQQQQQQQQVSNQQQSTPAGSTRATRSGLTAGRPAQQSPAAPPPPADEGGLGLGSQVRDSDMAQRRRPGSEGSGAGLPIMDTIPQTQDSAGNKDASAGRSLRSGRLGTPAGHAAEAGEAEGADGAYEGTTGGRASESGWGWGGRGGSSTTTTPGTSLAGAAAMQHGVSQRGRFLLTSLTLAAAETQPGGSQQWLSSHFLSSALQSQGAAILGTQQQSQQQAEAAEGQVLTQDDQQASCDLSVPLSMTSLTQGCSRLEASRRFFELLVLQTRGLCKLSQEEGPQPPSQLVAAGDATAGQQRPSATQPPSQSQAPGALHVVLTQAGAAAGWSSVEVQEQLLSMKERGLGTQESERALTSQQQP